MNQKQEDDVQRTKQSSDLDWEDGVLSVRIP